MSSKKQRTPLAVQLGFVAALAAGCGEKRISIPAIDREGAWNVSLENASREEVQEFLLDTVDRMEKKARGWESNGSGNFPKPKLASISGSDFFDTVESLRSAIIDDDYTTALHNLSELKDRLPTADFGAIGEFKEPMGEMKTALEYFALAEQEGTLFKAAKIAASQKAKIGEALGIKNEDGTSIPGNKITLEKVKQAFLRNIGAAKDALEKLAEGKEGLYASMGASLLLAKTAVDRDDYSQALQYIKQVTDPGYGLIHYRSHGEREEAQRQFFGTEVYNPLIQVENALADWVDMNGQAKLRGRSK